ncbi:ABC transporter permease [Photobacterium sp.]|uniref:ABC transporter permease n=1 Tax=Photobacterium sp. TaxID=660 RepID=UPI00299E7466|nr:ABC transporter permease [Photobacterium sp.]MDX1301566.1 FtsX-like permease family protein [Photobacterium sp.]
MMMFSAHVAFTLAWRNLWRNYRRTLIMLVAICLGVWAMIFMTALSRGMVDGMVRDGIRNLPGHVQVHHPDYLDDPSVVNSFAEPGARFFEALQAPEVTGWAMRVKVPAVISSERDTRGITLLGVDANAELQISFDVQDMVAGEFLHEGNSRGVIIGARLVEKLETRLGKRIVIMTQDPDNNIVDRGFVISGVYRSDIPGYEELYVYADRRLVQQMLAIEQQISEIAITGTDYRDNTRLKEAISASAPANLQVQTWKERDKYLATMVDVMDGFILVWIIVIFLALSFGLINTLIMAVFERVREIGLMRALGMRGSSVLLIILLESLLLLLLGLAVGNAIALVSIFLIKDGIDVSAVAEGMAMFGAGTVLYPALTLSDLALANVVVIILGLLTCLYPAWRASRYDPIVALNKH